MTPKEALNNIAIISEILVEVSKSHIMDNEAINEIRGLDIGEAYFTLRQALKERDIYFQALCDIEKGEDVRKVLERTLT